jgi:presequence protease
MRGVNMSFEINKLYSGFRLLQEQEVKAVNSTARIFVHEKSGARLLSLSNDDDNKVFGIGFRTPPGDSTGLPHILEHCVLCGSRKFPSKEPFVELLKGSLNTFLNAMTFSDKTIYPVASRNDKDFRNLMDVYLDAVLYPNIYKYPEIFKQEGWHYELEDKEGELIYNGVVYNEMKGAFSSPDSILSRKIRNSLFPDTPYGFESGGDPDVIPELTYEQFLDFHKRYYHPSNSYIFLYGNCDMEEQMRFIDDEYLSNFSKIKVESEIPAQEPFNEAAEMTIEYPADDLKDSAYLSLNFAIGDSLDTELYLGFEILEHLLLQTPAAPLKRALLEAEVGKSVQGQFDNGIKQPIFSVIVKNSNVEKEGKFIDTVYTTLRNLVNTGISKELIEASINKMEFILREADFHGYPKGLVYYIKSLDSWLYGGDPLLHFDYEPVLEKLKSALTTDYFEKMIDKYLLSNKHSSLVVLKPAKGIIEQKTEELKKELQAYKEKLSDKDLENLINDTNKLRERQRTPDSQEDIDTIPVLSLEDIDRKAEEIPLTVKDENGIKILFNPVFTSKIAYLNILLDTGKVPEGLLPYIGLLSSAMGKVSTGKYDYASLSNQINIHTGGIGFGTRILPENGKAEAYHPVFTVRCKALVSKLDKAAELISEMTANTRFDEKIRLLEIVREAKSRFEAAVYSRGHGIAALRALSYFSPKALYDDYVSGLNYYKFIADIEKNFEDRWSELSSNLKKVSELIFNKNNIIVNFVSEEEDYDNFKANLDKMLEGFKTEEVSCTDCSLELKKLNEGLLTQNKVQFAAKAGNYIKAGYKYTGTLQVLKTIVGLDYLWNQVRVMGGAYGVMSSFGRDGNAYIVSYRDPKLKETLDIYDSVEKYIREFNADEKTITKYIIGTISNLDFPLTPAMKGDVSSANYICNITTEDLQQERDQVINTKVEDIQRLADLVKGALSQNYICVLGNDAKIKENKDIFENLVTVIQ